MSEPTGPLKGLRILDLTTVLFGPFGTQTLGDWGAEIIKVESLTGDTWRTSGVFRNRGMSGQFMAANRNKRSIAVDLKHSDGKEVLRRLIPTADALVSNIRPAGLARLGFNYEHAGSSIRASCMRAPSALARMGHGARGRRSTK
jgi:crotonobetainyl-CoA:carnitine CoA-transferase CaiB-like acyl-CoA transferase